MQQGGGSPYGAPPPPEQLPFPGGARVAIPGPDHLRPAEPASPISSRPPSLTAPASASASASASAMANFDDPAPSAAHGNFPDDDFGERVAATGSRWPRQETLALLKIRSDMDAAFRDATLKAPLWEEISRKLAELGYRRNAKKCKEKFENVHKYYKRTKEGRAGRQDGKSYRFFDQLEALHGANATSSASTAPVPVVTAPAVTPSPLPGLMEPSGVAAGTSAPAQPATVPLLPIMPPAGISFSSNTSSSSASESEDTEGGEGRKRKRGGGGGASRKMLAFFEGLMRQVIERQEAMQQRLMEAIEKREEDRMVREEAWRRQEMARLAREHELLAQERAAAASRDAAVITFLQTLTGQSIQLPPPLCTAVRAPSPAPPPPPQPQQVQTQQPQQPQQHPSQPPQQQTSSSTEIVRHYQPPASTELVPVPETQETPRGMSFEPASSRWPKVEVHALISLRSSLDARYQEPGPKAPLWEEISSEMRRLGYNRSAKRCKEKWENINKYFKKVKESNKRRPEDAKTCPYFHQLDALYRQKLLANTRPQEINPSPHETTAALAILAPPPQVRHPETENKNGNGGSAFEEGTSSTDATMKPEDFVKELMKSTQQKEVMDDYDKLEELESEDDDVDDEEDEGEKMQYRVQFQRPNQSGGAAPATGSFLAMV